MNNLYPTYYEVQWYEDSDRGCAIPEAGFIFAKDYADAAKQIEDYYGVDLECIDKLIQYDTNALTFENLNAARAIKIIIEENA